MKTITGQIEKSNVGQCAWAVLPSGKLWECFGDITTDLENDYRTTVFDVNQEGVEEEVTVICIWA